MWDDATGWDAQRSTDSPDGGVKMEEMTLAEADAEVERTYAVYRKALMNRSEVRGRLAAQERAVQIIKTDRYTTIELVEMQYLIMGELRKRRGAQGTDDAHR